MEVSRLLKSCARPPVSCPTASIFWLWRRRSSATCSSALRACTRSSRVWVSWRSWVSANRRSVTSEAVPNHSVTAPASSSNGTARISTHRTLPSASRARCSSRSGWRVAIAWAMAASSSGRSSGWTRSSRQPVTAGKAPSAAPAPAIGRISCQSADIAYSDCDEALTSAPRRRSLWASSLLARCCSVRSPSTLTKPRTAPSLSRRAVIAPFAQKRSPDLRCNQRSPLTPPETMQARWLVSSRRAWMSSSV